MKQKRRVNRVVRGGGWKRGVADCCAAYRSGIIPDRAYDYLGFRCTRVRHLKTDQLFCGGSHDGTTRSRSAYRNNDSRDIASRYLGFRCMRRRE
jgi:formylglycine-generating enzyme required for sulfatase activity